MNSDARLDALEAEIAELRHATDEIRKQPGHVIVAGQAFEVVDRNGRSAYVTADAVVRCCPGFSTPEAALEDALATAEKRRSFGHWTDEEVKSS